jgi:hypothetical protein
MNDRLVDPSLGVNHVNRNCVLRDPKMDGTTDASLCLRMNDPLDGHLKDDDRHDALVDHHMNGTDDLKMVVNLLNRNCAHRDLMTDGNLDGNRDLRMNDLLDDH